MERRKVIKEPESQFLIGEKETPVEDRDCPTCPKCHFATRLEVDEGSYKRFRCTKCGAAYPKFS